jgi:hypothetical protein
MELPQGSEEGIFSTLTELSGPNIEKIIKSDIVNDVNIWILCGKGEDFLSTYLSKDT